MTLPRPSALGAIPGRLRYITLPGLIQLKRAAGRARDESDVVELIRVNQAGIDAIRQHLSTIHPAYVTSFDRLVDRAREQQDE
jgi:hypothetical protein